ncbi:MAG: T9SS type A sorting domain-containing protein [candidate division KSB1 bacterium]|nr:T9SS type A sorting domain-containing protein [candidate division KSB1 bacterium]
MKKVLFTLLAMTALVSLAAAQWVFDADFVPVSQPHGIVITPDNKVWIAPYGRTDTMRNVAASVPLIYDLDGNLVQKLRFVNIGGTPDTLWNRARGIALDKDGNVLYTAFDAVYHINYQTLEGLHKIFPKAGSSLTEAAMDENGYVYVTTVLSGNPGYIYDEDFELYSYFADTVKSIQRSVIAGKDGKDVYVGAIYAGPNGVRHYYSPDGPDGTYTLVDTLGTIFKPDKSVARNMWAQCLDWDPWGMMWVGTYWDNAAVDFKSWYQLDPGKGYAVVDSLCEPAGNPSSDPNPPVGGKIFSPRGVAFYEKDNVWYALAADFDGNVIKRFKNSNPYTGVVEVHNGSVVRDYGLMQNYPNPFNPVTTIPFTLAKASFVELKVYDMNGREIKTLLSQKMNEGEHKVTFDASGLPTGHYFYRLVVDGKIMTKSMTLVK